MALVGSGPASLIAAYDLVRNGYRVTVFEALHGLGGVLAYGIPNFRLPRDIIRDEVDRLRTMGVEFRTDFIVGKIATVDELFAEGFQAVFLGTGAGLPHLMNIPGENLIGVYTANEYLTRLNLMEAFRFPESDTPMRIGTRVVVVGGGNSAMDAARWSRRMGARRRSCSGAGAPNCVRGWRRSSTPRKKACTSISWRRRFASSGTTRECCARWSASACSWESLTNQAGLLRFPCRGRNSAWR